ncbi:hypothetical protein DXG01_011296 [Tephrocybe rancida]|nr:hypothetical protein DXG01_011296 [Tephrocybe rancida]
MKRKATFDKRVLAETKEEVVFREGELVQVYRNDLDYTFKTEHKLLPKWSFPRRIVNRFVNSYTLATLAGKPISGRFSARRLRQFTPRVGTTLANEQAAFEAQLAQKCTESREEVVMGGVSVGDSMGAA